MLGPPCTEEFSFDELAYLAGKARLPEKLVRDTARETVELFHETWAAEKKNLPLTSEMIATIDTHVKKVPIPHK